MSGKHKAPPGPDVTQLKAIFVSSKLEWDKEFGRSMEEQRHLHIDEELQQAVGEKSRNTEFDRMLARMEETFYTNVERRDRSFQEAHTKRESIFRTHEDWRQKQFSEGEFHREVMFERDQEMRLKYSKQYVSIRRTLFEQGRQEREDICRKLESDLVEQFDSLLRFQEECFDSAERQRDEIVINRVGLSYHDYLNPAD